MADTRSSNDRPDARVPERSSSAELVDIETLTAELDGKELPGATLNIDEYKSILADYALLADDDNGTEAHMLWFLVLSLRGMGISVDELCDLAAKRPQDTLLFGNCELKQNRPLRVGSTFTMTGKVGPVSRKTTRKGDVLDFVTVRTSVFEGEVPAGTPAGEVINGYIFKRGAQ
mgnify:CR=1 FL=1